VSLSASLDAAESGVRVHALCPAFVDTPLAAPMGLPAAEMIRPEDCAEVVRMLLRLGPRARVPRVVIERLGGRP
jgi:NAD(P)-dependent dehydrogenase (short-subunit alcohol dehydrogenase family)